MTLTELPERHPVDRLDGAAQFSHPAVIVAVDGRPASEDALAWAADEALCRGMHLRIVTVFADPDHPHAPKTFDQALALQHRLRRRIARGRPWLEDAEHLIARGAARSVLNETARVDDILVVGEAAYVSAMEPSQRPACPVVVVPATPTGPVDDG